jgi:hypothetical protein
VPETAVFMGVTDKLDRHGYYLQLVMG